MDRKEEVFEDYVATRLTLREHPAALLREDMRAFKSAEALRETPDEEWVSVAGLVITRQRPGTASGVIFITLEDDTAVANIVVWPKVFEKFRKEVMAGRLLRISGRLQREGVVTHIIAARIEDYSYLLDTLGDQISFSDQIDPTRDNADEAKRPNPEHRTGPQSRSRPPVSEAITIELQRARHARYGAGARHPREQAKKLFYSRDFH